MSENNSNEPTEQDIPDGEEFNKLFFNGQPVEEKEPEQQEQVEEDDHEEVDDLATEDEDDSEEDQQEDEKPQGKKNRHSAQERINELTAKARAEERAKIAAEQREAELIRRLEALEAGRTEKKEEVKALRDQLPADAPDPDAKNEDGSPLYELGEFDKNYIRDLTKWTIEQENKVAAAKREQEAQAAAFEQARNELAVQWIEKLDTAEAEIPTIREDITNLTEVFQDLHPDYGEYLAATIMASDVGPQLMHYFSQNIGEAQKIVAAGPAAATLALGRLETRFLKSSSEQGFEGNRQKVSGAPPVPETVNRGSKGQFAVKPDTDDQAAFNREFFKKPRY